MNENNAKNQIINDFTQNAESFITAFIQQNFIGNEQLQELPGKVTNVNLNTVLKKHGINTKTIKSLNRLYQFLSILKAITTQKINLISLHQY